MEHLKRNEAFWVRFKKQVFNLPASDRVGTVVFKNLFMENKNVRLFEAEDHGTYLTEQNGGEKRAQSLLLAFHESK
jgi:hypothetical protein